MCQFIQMVTVVFATLGFLLLVGCVTGSSKNFWGFQCKGENYTSNNIDQMALLSTLPLKVSSTPTLFARVTINSTKGQINAVGQCRGDTNHTTCKSCITRALHDLQAMCVSSMQAIIYYDLCTLEISNKKIQLNIHHGLDSIAVQIDKSYVKSQQQMFGKTVSSLIAALISMVTNLSTRFATGKELLIVDNYKYTIYGLAQCSSELTRSQCQFCLKVLSIIRPSFDGSMGGRKAVIWCSYRYQLYHFFTGYPMLNLYTDQSTLKIKGNPRNHHKKVFWVVLSIVCIIVIIVSLITLYFCWKKWLKKNLKSSTDSATDTDKRENTDMVTCPSALASFEEITTSAHGKRVALFLDYDGTLSPIVDDPERAFMPPEIREAVRNIARLFPTSIVSGRSREKVFNFVQLPELNYAGSHGADILVATTQSTSSSEITEEQTPFQPTIASLPFINEAFRSLVEATKAIEGVKVEHNKLCLSVHYRNVDEKLWDLVDKSVREVMQNFKDLRMSKGQMVHEIYSKDSWNKGNAVEYLLDRLGLNSEDVLPIFIGDDTTDENAFNVLRQRQTGFGILVSDDLEKIKVTAAIYTLKDPYEVMEFLNSLASWREQPQR